MAVSAEKYLGLGCEKFRTELDRVVFIYVCYRKVFEKVITWFAVLTSTSKLFEDNKIAQAHMVSANCNLWKI